jgi:hypothetical protein
MQMQCNHCIDAGFQCVFEGGQAAAYMLRVDSVQGRLELAFATSVRHRGS